jgi:DNA-binding response OmpR family regulator
LFTIRHLTKGYEGLSFIRETPHLDVVLLDMDLPDVDGKNIASQLKSGPIAATALVAIIAISADCSERSKRMAHAFGCHDYICKPFDTRILATQINDILTRVRTPHPPATL